VTFSFIDLNADLGEGMTDDIGLLAVVTSANVACGYHAGDEQIMRKVCAVAARSGVSVGAQVSYNDRPNFGRVARDVSFKVLSEQIADQVGTLTRIARKEGTVVRYVKPHGALYHRVYDDAEQAQALLEGSGDLPVLGMEGALVLDRARAAGRRTFHEGFPDRAYTPDGRLVPRGNPGAVITDGDEVARRAVELAPRVDSLCVRAGTSAAVGVRRALLAAGYEVRGLR
jgi:UPF0271 protein